MVNRSEEEPMEVELFMEGFHLKRIKKFISMTAKHKKMTNQQDHKAVIPREREEADIIDEHCIVKIESLSFSMLCIEV